MFPVVPPDVHRQMFDILFSSPTCNPAPPQNTEWPQTPPQNYSSCPPTSTVFTFEPKQSQLAPQSLNPTCWNTSSPNQLPQFQYSMCPPLPKNQLRYIGLDPRFHVDEPYKLRLTHDRINCTEDLERTQNPRLPLAQVNIANKGAPLDYPPMPKRPQVTFVERTQAAEKSKSCGHRSCFSKRQGYGAQLNNNARQDEAERTTEIHSTNPERQNRDNLQSAHSVVRETCTVTEPQDAPTQEPIAAEEPAITQSVDAQRPEAPMQEPIAREQVIDQQGYAPSGEEMMQEARESGDAPRPEPPTQEPIAREPVIEQTVDAPRAEEVTQEAREPVDEQPGNAPRPEAPPQGPVAAEEPAIAQAADAPRPEAPLQEPIAREPVIEQIDDAPRAEQVMQEAREPVNAQPGNAPRPEAPPQGPVAAGEPAIAQAVDAPRPETPLQEPIAREPVIEQIDDAPRAEEVMQEAREPVNEQPGNAPRPEAPMQEPIAREPLIEQPVRAARPDVPTREPITAAEPTTTHMGFASTIREFNLIVACAILVIVASFIWIVHVK